MRKLLALPLAVPALAACNEPPYAKVDHVTIAEIEASSVVAAMARAANRSSSSPGKVDSGEVILKLSRY